MYKGEKGWVCHRHRPLRFFWVFSQRPKHQHLTFSVAVGSSIHHSFARILSRVQWWSVSMVTRYNVISRRWSSLFWVKVHVFFKFFFSTIKVNLVAKIMQSAYFVLFFFLSTKKSPYRSESKINSKLNELMPLTASQVPCILFVRHTLLLEPYQIDRLSFSISKDSWERPVDGRPRCSSEPPWSKHYFLRLLKA